MNTIRSVIVGIVALSLPAHAFAYVGPGAGITMLGALWGVIVAILAALAAVLYWPIKSLIRKRKKRLAADMDAEANVAASVETGADDSNVDRGD